MQELTLQSGIWISEAWLCEARIGKRARVVVQPGEIRIVQAPDDLRVTDDAQPVSKSAWDELLALVADAPTGKLPNASVEHDRYLYPRINP